MIREVDSYRQLTEQDYGPWLDAAEIWVEGARVFLKIEGGYSRPYDEAWYELSAKPDLKLETHYQDYDGLWASPTEDQSKTLAEELGVEVRQTSRPENVRD